MNTKYILLTALFAVISTFGQEFTVTPDGLRDSLDNDKSYVVIITPDKTAEQNYNNAIRYISKIYKNPKEVLKADIKAEYLKFDTFSPKLLMVKNSGAKVYIDVKYTTELSFKGNRVKYEIVNLDTGGVTFTGSIWTGFPIYTKKGKLKRPDTKKDIELYFNNTINNIKNEFLEKTSNSADDW